MKRFFAGAILTFCPLASFAQVTAPWCAPPNPTGCHKFVVYSSSPNHELNVEIIGTIAGWWPLSLDYIFIEPDPNYQHLLLDGNRHVPDDYATWEMWYLNIGRENVFKLEAHDGAGFRPATAGDGLPQVWDDLNQQWIPIQRGQRVRFSGLLATDVSHDPYHSLHTDPWCRARGIYRACDVHMEVHPYLWQGFTLYRPPAACLGPGCANTETLTVIAPIFQQVYSWTYLANQLAGIAGHFVDDYRQTSVVTPSLVITSPPVPAECAPPNSCHIAWDSSVIEAGNGTSYSTIPMILPFGISVQLAAFSDDGYWPKVRKETFRVWWELGGPTVVSVVPDRGPTTGGTPLTITGTNFAPGATVTVGGVPATNVAVVNTTTIRANSPPHAIGAVDIQVNVNGQSSSLPHGFVYEMDPAAIMTIVNILLQ
jgi:hypothetical protein